MGVVDRVVGVLEAVRERSADEVSHACTSMYYCEASLNPCCCATHNKRSSKVAVITVRFCSQGRQAPQSTLRAKGRQNVNVFNKKNPENFDMRNIDFSHETKHPLSILRIGRSARAAVEKCVFSTYPCT